MSGALTSFADVESCVEATLQRIGRRIHLATPLGLGKANHLVNEFYRRAREDPRIELRISTALTLAKPGEKNDIERRFLEPLAERLFGGYPDLEYLEPLRKGELPENIRVTEFYFQLGALKRWVASGKVPLPRRGDLRKLTAIPVSAGPFLERMGLDTPRTLREKVLRRVIVYALMSVDAI